MDDVRNWLNGNKNYDEGVKLLVKYSSDERLKRLYQIEGATDFKRNRLLQELQKIYNSGAKTHHSPLTTHQPTHHSPLTIANPSKWPVKMDEVVAALFQQWKPLYSERNDLCSRLYDVAKQNESQAGKMAHRIMDLDDAIDIIYDKRDYYLQHGHLLNESKPKKFVVDPIKMPLALANAERYVRTFKNKLKKHPENVKTAAKLKQWEETVIYYKKELKIDG